MTARDPLGRREDAAILREAAGAMNAFADDGSFMERFSSHAAGVLGIEFNLHLPATNSLIR